MGRDHGERGDRGNVMAFEVLLFLVLLSIPLLVMQGQHPAGTGVVTVRDDIAHSVGDWLAHAAVAPDAGGTYARQLDRMVAEALQGNDTGLAARLGRVLPKVSAYNVFVDNGVSRLVLRNDGTPPGEAVSAPQLWSPAWGPILAAPQASLVDPERSALRLAMVPVARARGLQDQPGLHVDLDLALPDGTIVTLGSTAPLANATAPGPAAALSLLDSAGKEVFTVQPAAANATLFFGLRETQGRAIPAGTTLEVRLPPGFAGVALAPAGNPAWSGLSVAGNSTAGWTVRANLSGALAGTLEQLQVNATRPPWGHFHLLQADLGGGALGQLRGLFIDGANATRSAALPPGRGPFLSLPGNAPWSAAALAGVVVAYPDDQARTLTVTRVEVNATGGASVSAASGVEPPTGWAATAQGLAWTGALSQAQDGAREFRFQVQASAPPSPASGAFRGLRAETAGAYAAWTEGQAGPGLFALRLAPRNASAQGFPETPGAAVVRLNGTHRAVTLTGAASYAVVTTNVVQASASDLARGLDESWLRVEAPRADVGGTVPVRWDLTRLRQELVGLAADGFKCYTTTAGAWAWRTDRADCLAAGGLDWQFRDEAPAVNLTVYHPAPGAAGTVGPAAQAVAGLDPQGTWNLTVSPAALLGTHVVELRADFRLLGPGGAEALQSVRLLGAFDTQRPGGVPGERPLYDVVVQAWLQDWT